MKLQSKQMLVCALAGFAAGCVNGIFGAAGGMVLIPALSLMGNIPEQSLFPMSVCVMLPVCILTVLLSGPVASLPWSPALPYLIGGALGGIGAGIWGHRIPVPWLHRIFGILILWGGLRYLWK